MTFQSQLPSRVPALTLWKAVLVVLGSSTLVPHVNADGTGVLGAGKWLYEPVCAHACRRLINTSPLLCIESINGTDYANHDSSPPTPECHLRDAAYTRTLSLCIERGCTKDKIRLSAVEHYWEGHLATGTVGDRTGTMQPLRSYQETLKLAHDDVRKIGEENMLTAVNGEPLNQTSYIDEALWIKSYNGQYIFQEGEFDHGRNSIAIAVTTCAMPILFSLGRFLPTHSPFASRISIWLDQPFVGHRHRIPIAGNAGVMPTRGQSLFIAYIILSNILLACLPMKLLQPNYIAPSEEQQLILVIGDRTGVLAMADFVALFLFSSRNNVLLWITNWSHSTFLLLHRWVAYACIFQTVMHSILMLVLYDRFHHTHATESQLPYWYWGIIATLLLVVMWPLAILPLRRKAYQIFLSSHQVLAALALIATFLHIWYLFQYKWGYEIWVYIAGGLWFFDRAMRIIRIASNGVRTATVTSLDSEGNYFRIDIEGIVAEGHVYLYFPTISWRIWENHPFSVLSTFSGSCTTSQGTSRTIVLDLAADSEKSIASGSQGVNSLARGPSSSDVQATTAATGPARPQASFLFRGLSGATHILAHRTLGGNNSLSVPVLVESSYEANPSIKKLARCSSFLGIAGGVGITAVLPLARTFGGLRARLCWGMRSEHLLRSATVDLAQLSSNIQVDTVVGARLPLEQILRQAILREDETSDIGIVVCGPGGMADECRRIIGEISASGKVRRGIVFIDEAFSW